MNPIGYILKNSCGDCGDNMVLRKGRYNIYFRCVNFPQCRGSHSAHQAGQKKGEPMGNPADYRTRKLRQQTHEHLDKIWMTSPHHKKLGRRLVYDWLAAQMGLSIMDCHVSRFTADQCEEALELCKGKAWEDIDGWHHAYNT